MTRVTLLEFGIFSHFDEINKQWIYTHNDKIYAISKDGTKELTQ